MGMTGGNEPDGLQSTLSEINVTPLVDVMLVLLTIFMVASSVETIQVAAERERLLKERQEEEEQTVLLQKLQRLEAERDRDDAYQRRDNRRVQFMQMQEEKLREIEEQLDDRSQNVPIDLPKATSEAVNLAEQKKIVVTLTREHAFYLGDTRVVDCTAEEFVKAAPEQMAKAIKEKARRLPDAVFRACLATIEKKLVANEKLKSDGECYLRADRQLDYGEVLALMATIRKAGITRFGLVAEEFEEAQNPSEKKP